MILQAFIAVFAGWASMMAFLAAIGTLLVKIENR